MKYVLILSVLLLSAPAWGQPATQPATKAPVTKTEPATAPVAAPAVKTEGEVKVVATETKITPPAATPVAAPNEDAGLSYGGLAVKYAMQLGFLLLSLLLSGFVTVLLKKFGFQAQNEKIQDVLMKGAAFAEQWALKKAKVEGTAKPGGPEKMAEAICFAMKLAKEYKLPEKGKDWWEEKLESWLGVKNGS